MPEICRQEKPARELSREIVVVAGVNCVGHVLMRMNLVIPGGLDSARGSCVLIVES